MIVVMKLMVLTVNVTGRAYSGWVHGSRRDLRSDAKYEGRRRSMRTGRRRRRKRKWPKVVKTDEVAV